MRLLERWKNVTCRANVFVLPSLFSKRRESRKHSSAGDEANHDRLQYATHELLDAG